MDEADRMTQCNQPGCTKKAKHRNEIIINYISGSKLILEYCDYDQFMYEVAQGRREESSAWELLHELELLNE